jgi:hypothetical protein
MLRNLVRYGATPVFLLLAVYNYLLEYNAHDSMAMMGMAHSSGPLSSMWLMYALMGVFHSGGWLNLLARK